MVSTDLQTHISSYFDVRQDQSVEIAKLFVPESLERGAVHTAYESRHGKLSFVKTGLLRIFRQTDKKEVTQWISTPGEFCTELGSTMFNQPSRWQIEAITDCELYTIDNTHYQAIKETIANWASIEKLFLAKCFMMIEERIFSFISMSAEERYNYLSEIKPEIMNQVPLQYIASMLGMTPETLSRIRKKPIS